MGKYLILILLIPVHAFATVPECPLQKNMDACLQTVDSTFEESLKYLEEMIDEENPFEMEKMLEASLDIKKYETLACQKTCSN